MKIRIISLLFSLLCATTWGQQQGDRGILWADTLSTAANIARNAVAMQDDEQWDCSGGANAFRHNLYHRTNRSTA